nr:ruBisCO large subunit-binding protein subunit beta, chloroplastic [Ipomoea batatas]
MIGQGAYGPVYKAQLSTGESVTVKVLAMDSKQGEKEFQTEVVLLGRLHHRNLVNLLGYCAEKGQNMLIYVYMSKGSLASQSGLRVEDALNATKAAVEEGIVVGGGCTLLRLSSKVDALKESLENEEEKAIGADIVKRALSYPLKLIAKNAGVNGSVVSEKVLSSDNPKYGYNAATCNYEDLMDAGIIDPTKHKESISISPPLRLELMTFHLREATTCHLSTRCLATKCCLFSSHLYLVALHKIWLFNLQ